MRGTAGKATAPGDRSLLILYAVTIGLAATLLFLVQPMFARMVLPRLGGAPAVWTTTLVFYQAALLAGYAYAHATTAWLGARRQAVLHLSLVAAAALVLPIAIPPGWSPPTEANPIPSLLALLLVAVGLPFFAVSATSPLLQRWLAGTGHRAAADPYFLYGISNFGSMLALLAYPTLVEPSLPLDAQSRAWATGYALLSVLTSACALGLWRAGQTPTPEPSGLHDLARSDGFRVGRRIHWLLLAFVPSSLMLSVTTYLSTDIAAIPLLWIVPLAIYLLTFSLTFARRPVLPHRLMVGVLPITLLPLVMVLAARANEPIALVIPAHLATFFVAAMVCHGELARDRPPTAHLTLFYLWLAAGGVLGGIFTAIVAPLVFRSVAEYPLMLVLACLLTARPDPPERGWRPRLLDIVFPVALGALAIGVLAGIARHEAGTGPAGVGLVVGLLALVCVSFARRPVRFGLGIGAILLASALSLGKEGRVLHAERSFFGIHRVTLDPSGQYHLLLHGTTLHGVQSLDPSRRLEPLAYFHRESPIGQVFTAFGGADATVAVVGLGTGTLACHGRPGQRWTFYEIDPAVERLARDPRYFTFLRDCPPHVEVILGDARVSLARTSERRYGLIILDAYSSDTPPVHLLTREALALYLDKLDADGLLAFNISNRHLDLEPVLGYLARDAGLVGLIRHHAAVSAAEFRQGKTPSKWVVMARHRTHLGGLAADPGWRLVKNQPRVGVWTDDFSALLSVFAWR